jgi:hypothetical protein
VRAIQAAKEELRRQVDGAFERELAPTPTELVRHFENFGIVVFDQYCNAALAVVGGLDEFRVLMETQAVGRAIQAVVGESDHPEPDRRTVYSDVITRGLELRELKFGSVISASRGSYLGYTFGPLFVRILEDRFDPWLDNARARFQEAFAVSASFAEPNRAIVDAFLSKCRQYAQPRGINRTHIWKSVGHKSARQFQYWQAGDPKATAQDDQNFRRILALSPADFIAQLKGQGFL